MTRLSEKELAPLAAWAQEEMRREVLEPTVRHVEAQRRRCQDELAQLRLDSDDLLVREDAEMMKLYLDGQLLRLERIVAGIERELAELPARLRAHLTGAEHA
jgi:hypothetical protein